MAREEQNILWKFLLFFSALENDLGKDSKMVRQIELMGQLSSLPRLQWEGGSESWRLQGDMKKPDKSVEA